MEVRSNPIHGDVKTLSYKSEDFHIHLSREFSSRVVSWGPQFKDAKD